MSKTFPHLDDTAFPDLNGINTYKYKNDFDYSRWGTTTKIHLCRVLWNNDYRDVVKFNSNADRDSWFDNLNSKDITLTSAFQMPPDKQIKVPIPYNVAVTYNYCFIELPIMTSDNNPIDYENVDRITRFYFFIDSCERGAANSTGLNVTIDNWTTYINDIDLPYLMLERGHAPMAEIDTDTYLSSPIDNNMLLLADDVNFGNGTNIVANSRFVPVNNGKKYILVAFTMSIEQLRNVAYANVSNVSNTAPTFANTYDRYGYQYEVNEYAWNNGGIDYSLCDIQSQAFQSLDGSIPNNMCVVAIASIDAKSFFDNMSKSAIYLFKSIKATYMVDDTMFNHGEDFMLCDTLICVAEKVEDSLLQSISLDKDDFGYPDSYKKIAKLYTFPYSELEATDNNGNKKSFRIENTSSIEARKNVSIAYPYISIQAYLIGVNGNGSNTYKWDKLDDSQDTRNMYADDFGDFIWKWDIPTYALYVNAYDAYKADNFAEQNKERYDAIRDYQKSVRMANTEFQNSVDAANNTNVMTGNSANTELANADRAAKTTYDIAADSATAGRDNTNDSADTAATNANASANTANTNADNSADTAIANTALATAASAVVTARNNQMKNYTNVLSCEMNSSNQAWDAGLTRAMTDAENTATTAAGVMNAVSDVGSGVGGALGALGSGNVLGAVGSLVSGGASAMAAGVTTSYTVAKNSTVAEASISNTGSKTSALNTNNNQQNDQATSANTDNTTTGNNAQISETANSASLERTNAANTKNTAIANAGRTQGMTKGNATRSFNASMDNAAAQRSTTETNASATNANTIGNASLNKNLTIANSGYTRGSSVANEQVSLVQKQYDMSQNYNRHKMDAPITIGSNSGDYTLDSFERRGIQIKIRTQAKGAIAQAGDVMLRYGYMLNQIWDMHSHSLTPMKHFSFWKANEIWLNTGSGVNQDAQNDIKEAFLTGVTIWSNPDEIGKVSIYDNQ